MHIQKIAEIFKYIKEEDSVTFKQVRLTCEEWIHLAVCWVF